MHLVHLFLDKNAQSAHIETLDSAKTKNKKKEQCMLGDIYLSKGAMRRRYIDVHNHAKISCGMAAFFRKLTRIFK